ncbi:MAG: DUF2974 domain-containing protein [Erysipelotrichales bacterium]|nr:DUF2974 domain-containing protein [Erysipelotrichales bacterium]
MLIGNILDYLDWRGDLSLNESPFNEIDSLVLSMLSYVSIDELVPNIDSNDYISVYTLGRKFFEKNTPEILAQDKSLLADSYLVLKHMQNTVRFKNAKLGKFYSNTDAEKEMQFAAVHILLDDGTTYIAYRGTDDSLVGWKEDFNMAYKAPVPSQIAAREYLNTTVKFGFRKYRLGGHSKGGNLAVYAAVECDDRIKNRIINVYSNDGPGFRKGMIESPKYQKMKSKIISIIPESSIIGLLLEHHEEHVVVKSNQVGLLQHDALTWEVLGTNFITIDKLSAESVIISQTVSNWLNEIDDERREKFVDTVYDVITKTGMSKLSDFNNVSLKQMNAFVKGITELDNESRNMIFEILKALTSEYGRVVKNQFMK